MMTKEQKIWFSNVIKAWRVKKTLEDANPGTWFISHFKMKGDENTIPGLYNLGIWEPINVTADNQYIWVKFQKPYEEENVGI